MAKLGAIVKSIGLVATSAQLKILAIGFPASSFDFCNVVRMSAEAPSLMADALAAVTVPSFLNTDFRVGTFSSFRPWYSSSSFTVTVPFLVWRVTGAISGVKEPDFQASAARR